MRHDFRHEGRPFPAFSSDFDKKFNRGFKFLSVGAIVGIIGGWVVSLGVLSFIGWVVLQVMKHYGVI